MKPESLKRRIYCAPRLWPREKLCVYVHMQGHTWRLQVWAWMWAYFWIVFSAFPLWQEWPGGQSWMSQRRFRAWSTTDAKINSPAPPLLYRPPRWTGTGFHQIEIGRSLLTNLPPRRKLRIPVSRIRNVKTLRTPAAILWNSAADVILIWGINTFRLRNETTTQRAVTANNVADYVRC